MQGITIHERIGLGDALQFSSLPENYFRATGQKLLDISRRWFFDFNPYVIRDDRITPEKTTELWNFGPKQYDWKNPRRPDQPAVYLSNAELHASIFGVPTVLNRPRLYQYEDVPFEKRELILLHVDGRSHGQMPEHVIAHVVKKYSGTNRLYQIGLGGPHLGIPKIRTETFWDLAKVISEARMLIGMDSGPSWIAACYPDVIVKKLRTKPSAERFVDWVPLEIENIHSHWDDRCHQIFTPAEDDIGFTSSYRKI